MALTGRISRLLTLCDDLTNRDSDSQHNFSFSRLRIEFEHLKCGKRSLIEIISWMKRLIGNERRKKDGYKKGTFWRRRSPIWVMTQFKIGSRFTCSSIHSLFFCMSIDYHQLSHLISDSTAKMYTKKYISSHFLFHSFSCLSTVQLTNLVRISEAPLLMIDPTRRSFDGKQKFTLDSCLNSKFHWKENIFAIITILFNGSLKSVKRDFWREVFYEDLHFYNFSLTFPSFQWLQWEGWWRSLLVNLILDIRMRTIFEDEKRRRGGKNRKRIRFVMRIISTRWPHHWLTEKKGGGEVYGQRMRMRRWNKSSLRGWGMFEGREVYI